MRDLLKEPLWKADDLGCPIPDSVHAVSVALPLWEHIIGYEEGDEAVLDAMQTGYPRFFVSHAVRRLCELLGGNCLVFPSALAAKRCVEFLTKLGSGGGVFVDSHESGLFVVRFPGAVQKPAQEYWRFCGEIVSTRQALAAGAGKWPEILAGEQAEKVIRERIAALTGESAEDVYLFPTGMAAVAALHRALLALFPGRKTAQFDFPYVDALKVQQAFGAGVHFFPVGNAAAAGELAAVLEKEKLAGIFTEAPSNPLLRSPDLEALREMAERRETPLLVDDTIGTNVNIDVYPFADAVTTSLTKYFSGIGDVMAGSLVLRGSSPFHASLRAHLESYETAGLFWEDAVVLEENSRDYADRVRRINANADEVFEYLVSHPRIDAVYHPRIETPAAYERLRREGGGFGGLLSFDLARAAERTPKFYDKLRISKGPSLGTNYSLVCPYTMLAHYPELDWAESCGVSRYLIRMSVGLEDPDELKERIAEALK